MVGQQHPLPGRPCGSGLCSWSKRLVSSVPLLPLPPTHLSRQALGTPPRPQTERRRPYIPYLSWHPMHSIPLCKEGPADSTQQDLEGGKTLALLQGWEWAGSLHHVASSWASSHLLMKVLRGL